MELLSRHLLHCRRSGVFKVNFEQISHIALVFPLLTLSKYVPVEFPIFISTIWICSPVVRVFFRCYHCILKKIA